MSGPASSRLGFDSVPREVFRLPQNAPLFRFRIEFMILPPSLESFGDDGDGRFCGDVEWPFWAVLGVLGMDRSFCDCPCPPASIMTSIPNELFLRVQNDPLIFFLNGLLDDAMLSWLGVIGLFVGVGLRSKDSSDNFGGVLPDGRLRFASKALILPVLPVLLFAGGGSRFGVYGSDVSAGWVFGSAASGEGGTSGVVGYAPGME